MKQPVAGFDLITFARRHPFLTASLALHALLAGALWLAGPYAVVQRALEPVHMEAALQEARREQVQRHLERLEQLAKEGGEELEAEPPGSAASGVVERAEAMTKRLEDTERKARIKEMARLLKITPEEAAAQVRLEDAKRAKPPPRDAAQALAQLEGRARDVVERQRARALRDSEGHRVAARSAAQGEAGGGQGGQGGGAGAGGGGGWQSRGPDNRQYDAPVQPPSLDAADVRMATGRRFGPGAAYANRVYLDNWAVTGPFPAENTRSINAVLPPEIAVDLDAVYVGKHGLVGWRPQQSPTYPFIQRPWEDDAMYYAATEVHVDRDMDVWLDIGADDDTKLWLNDELVWFSGNGDKPWYHDHYSRLSGMATYGLVEGRVRVHLRAGRNTLLLKLYNASMEMFFSVVIAS